jgi:protein SCO1/2
MAVHTSAARRAGGSAGAAVRAVWLTRLLLAAWAGISGATGMAAPACAQASGRLGPAFELTDHNGRPFSSAALAGQPYAVFFGFTNCPDVCPTTLLEMSNNLKALGADADRLRVVFITVDPERDSPEQLRQHLRSFDARIVGLTGSEPRIAAVAKGWNAFHNKIREADGSYTVVHSAYIYLMDRGNRLVDTMGFLDTEADQVAKLKALIGSRE